MWQGPRFTNLPSGAFAEGQQLPEQPSLSSPAARAGDPRLAALRIIPLFLQQSTNPKLFVDNNGVPLEFSAPGSCVLYDPTGASIPVDLEIAFDSLVYDGAGNILNFQALGPGSTLDVRPGSWRSFFLRSTSLYVNSISGTSFLGNLIVSSSMIQQNAGSTPAQAVYVRDVPKTLAVGNATQGLTGTTNWVDGSPTSTGIFRFLYTPPGQTAGALVSGIDWWFKTAGPGSVFLALSGTLTNGSSQVALQQVYEIPADGVERQFSLYPTPNTPFSPTSVNLQQVFIYSGTAGATISWRRSIRG